MEVGALSQGGQVSLNVSKSTDNTAQVNTSLNSSGKKANINEGNGNSSDNNADVKDVKKAIEKINKFLEDDSTHAVYEIHDKFKDIMIKIVDDKTGQVIQELPPKKILDMVAKMCELVGVLFDKKA
jgi:flagellar protein FlaG